MTKRIAAAGFLVLAAVAALAPIRSYDYFWHLTTGRWIVDHHSIPRFDPLTVASAHVPWINGEWLYEIVLYALHGIGGDAGISIMSALLAAAIFATGFVLAARDQDLGVALLVAAVAFAGASDRLGVRPAAAAALLIVIAIGLLGSRLRLVPLTIAYACVTIVWINVHPSALLAPVLALISMLQEKEKETRQRAAGGPAGEPPALRAAALRGMIVAAGSAIALLVNPYGWNAIVAPLRLTSEIRSGAFVNAEWLPSSFAFFPLLYVTIGAAVLLFIGTREKRAN